MASRTVAPKRSRSLLPTNLEHGYFDRADREKGRFRSFLLSAFKACLCDAFDRAHAVKRGGGMQMLAFEVSNGEEMYAREPVCRVMERLREEFVRHGRLDHFNRIRFALLGEASIPYADLARELETASTASAGDIAKSCARK